MSAAPVSWVVVSPPSRFSILWPFCPVVKRNRVFLFFIPKLPPAEDALPTGVSLHPGGGRRTPRGCVSPSPRRETHSSRVCQSIPAAGGALPGGV
jgi:hypothetical protein